MYVSIESLIKITNNTVLQRAKPANKWEMTQFHTDDYIDFLSRVTPENMEQYQKEQAKCNRLITAIEIH